MLKTCVVCGNKVGLFSSVSAKDGKVCSKCSVRFYQVTNNMMSDGFKDKGIFSLTGNQICAAIEKADKRQERIKRDLEKRKAAFQKQQLTSKSDSDEKCFEDSLITTADETI